MDPNKIENPEKRNAEIILHKSLKTLLGDINAINSKMFDNDSRRLPQLKGLQKFLQEALKQQEDKSKKAAEAQKSLEPKEKEKSLSPSFYSGTAIKAEFEKAKADTTSRHH